MSHPSEFFVRFALAQAWGEGENAPTTQEALNKTLRSFGLLGLLEHHYDFIMGSFEPPTEFRFHSQRHAATKEFMESEKLVTLWKADKDAKRVLDELVDGHMLVKQDLHLLLMGRLPHEVITDKLNRKYRLHPGLTQEMVSIYAHYFWNVERASHDEWEELLAGRTYRDAFMAALYCGEQQALYRAGFSPRVDGNRAMKEVYRQAYFKIEALRHKADTRANVTDFSALASKLTKVHEILYSQGTGLQDQLKEFRQIMMQHKDPDVAAVDTVINKLEGGSYSGDGADEEPEKQQGDLQ